MIPDWLTGEIPLWFYVVNNVVFFLWAIYFTLQVRNLRDALHGGS